MTMIRPRLATAAALLVAFGLFAIPKDAEASGYLTARYGADEGTPAMPNAFAIYFNPAALGGTTGSSITGDLSGVARFIRYTRPTSALSPSDKSELSDPNYVRANSGTANLSSFLALPFLGAYSDFGTKNFHAGYALYIPFGGQDSWTRRAGAPGVPGSTDGVQRWANISGSLLAIYNTFAVAYRIAPAKISLGASISPVIHTLSSAAARNADGSDDSVVNGHLVEGRVKVDGTGLNLAATGGIYFDPSDAVHLGFSYISQPGFGDTKIHGTLRTQLGGGQESQTRVDFIQAYPDVVRLGGTFQATHDLMLRGDIDFERWSTFTNQCIVEEGAKCAVDLDGRRQDGPAGNKVQLNLPRHFQDAINVRFGPAYRFSDSVQGFGSMSYGTSAVPKQYIDATTFDSEALFFTLGAHVKATDHLHIAGSYTHIYYLNVNTDGKSLTNLPNNPDPSYNVSRSPSADGRYRSQVGLLNVNISYNF